MDGDRLGRVYGQRICFSYMIDYPVRRCSIRLKSHVPAWTMTEERRAQREF